MSDLGEKAEDHVDHETSAHSDKSDLRAWLRLLSSMTLIETELRSRLRIHFQTTLPRFDFLAALDKAQEPLTMGEISKRSMVSNGNITGVADRLDEEGLITRYRAESDKRTQYVELTAQGQLEFGKMASEHGKWIAAAFADLSEVEVQALMQLLAKVKVSARRNLIDNNQT
jgi:DNA-binding MarR family transcriptional regulator